ncbi:MobF family relaxase [Pectobacterium brasiliense]|uniref:MobF family relaxase n=1 Tax=Pectobacterium brasiliense TaxID=180957 RepID=UPI001968F1CF|nr:MobF family relaxase [Pectobacterium brasiliense]MBN3262941.1 conjugative relaxase [Pectobacterium brasiliense]
MMSVAPVASAGGAAGYYSNSDNYYFLGNLQSLWLGEGAKELGLEGAVKGDALTSVLEGRLPDGSRLGKEINGNHVHRPGHDLTFSAPKSVSILVLIGGDKKLLEAHNQAVKTAASYVEKLVSARETKDGVTSIIPTEKMVAAAFTHDTSRNLDPQLHTHVLVANMTELGGKWKALATDYIHDAGFIETVMKMQVTLGKIYRSALREQVEALGHEVEIVGKHGMWEIKGVPEEIRDEYSSRGKEIEGAVGADATLRSRDVAAKDTRQAKVDPSRFRLMERWLNQMKDKGYDLKAYQDSVKPVDPEQPQSDISAPATLEKPTNSGLSEIPSKDTQELPLSEKTDVTKPDSGRSPQGRSQDTASPNQGEVKPENPNQAQPTIGVSEKADKAIAQEKRENLNISPPTVSNLKQMSKQPTPASPNTPTVVRQEFSEAVRMAISQLSDSKTRFTWGELMLTVTEFSDSLPKITELKGAIDDALKEGLIIPLDSEKGVFTSRIHLLDELSIQALSKDLLRDGKVVSFTARETQTPAQLKVVETDSIVLMSAPSGVAAIRDLADQITEVSRSGGRDVRVLASSAERAISLGRSAELKDRLISRQHILSGDFSLKPQSTLVIEGAEKLGLKETLVLIGEAREKDAQLVFLDSASRQANGNAMSVLESAGVPRSKLTQHDSGLETSVISIADKRDRYEALANRYAELSAGDTPVTAVAVGQREQKHLTGLIRDALQNAGQLERDGIKIESRVPVYLDSKTRRQFSSYSSGQVLEDRSNAKETRHYVIDRVHEETKVLTLIDSDGVLTRQKISDLSADWRLFNSEIIGVNSGEQLLAVAADKQSGLKAKDRISVTGISNKGIEVLSKGKVLTLPTDKPLYITHGYVASPGGRDNESGFVLATLNSRDINTRMMNSLSQSGDRAEVFTAETLDKVESRLQRMNIQSSPLSLIKKLSGKEDVNDAVQTLQTGVLTEAKLAVTRAIAEQREVTFNELKLLESASEFYNKPSLVRAEIAAQIKSGDLMSVPVRGETRLIARSTWEMEKSIIRVVDEGKNTQPPLFESVDASLLNGLTAGQKQSALLILGTTDQFVGIQGYAGVGKTTQLRAVQAAIGTLAEGSRPIIQGLAPTHQAVKEMSDTGVPSQTVKSFLVDHDQQVAQGEKPDYRDKVFLIDESSMVGLQDTAAAYVAIRDGGGRAVSMGDIDQFESVDSGAPFKLVQERSPMDVAIMKEIVRQRDVQLKSAVTDIIDNRIDAALQRISSVSPSKVPRVSDAYHPISSLVETESPVKDIVADWLDRTDEARGNTLIITQLNDDRKSVNRAIHEALVDRKELGEKAVVLPVLEKIKHKRHEFNKTNAWAAGMVVKRGDRYQSVIAVDAHGSMISVRNEDGRLAMYSPKELLVGDVELFKRDFLEVRAGDQIRFTASNHDNGQKGNDKFRIESVNDSGELVLQGKSGQKIINPKEVITEQHIDYAWAVTGYGAQGASSEYVISLEGTEGGRRNLATHRAFYISASRAKEHVQIYTDGLKKWVSRVKAPESEVKTAHDALKPETQRQQAKAIWAMGQPLSRTAIGRAWVRHQGVGDHHMTTRIIPATRRHPEPAMALPLYDGNGKSAGLALVSIVSNSTGQLTQGDVRMVATEGAQGAILQRSLSGVTVVTKDIASALEAIRNNPDDGVVWQTGKEEVTNHFMKVTRGNYDAGDMAKAQYITEGEQNFKLPPHVMNVPFEDFSSAMERTLEDMQQIDMAERLEATKQLGISQQQAPNERIVIPFDDEKSVYLPESPVDDPQKSASALESAARKLVGHAMDEDAERKIAAQFVDKNQPAQSHKTPELHHAARIASELSEQAVAERHYKEPGQTQERMVTLDEPGHHRHIQKEK